jgi:hypothetical protein|tara:strand:- start:238 stop:459 length:222 start_codon:yes stop_codon:yes gene_type:complete
MKVGDLVRGIGYRQPYGIVQEIKKGGWVAIHFFERVAPWHGIGHRVSFPMDEAKRVYKIVSPKTEKGRGHENK